MNTYDINELGRGDTTVWEWLQRASACSIDELADMAGVVDPGQLDAVGRTRLYYLYMLLMEADARKLGRKLPTWLRQPLRHNWAADIKTWDVSYRREEYYCERYLGANAEEDLGCTTADNPYRKLEAIADGRNPIELLIAEEWETVLQVLSTRPLLHPSIQGYWRRHWQLMNGHMVPYTRNSSWEPKRLYHYLIGDDSWELSGDYKRIDAEITKLFPYPRSRSSESWTQSQLQASVEGYAGCDINQLVDPAAKREAPREGANGDHWLYSRFAFLRALDQRAIDVPAWLQAEHRLPPEPRDWVRGQRDTATMTGLQALRDERWVGLWQALEEEPFRYLPRISLKNDTWEWDDEFFVSDYTEERIFGRGDEHLLFLPQPQEEQLRAAYPFMNRLLDR